jgi:PAS domain S-box
MPKEVSEQKKAGGAADAAARRMGAQYARAIRRAVFPPLLAMMALTLLLFAQITYLNRSLAWVEHTDHVLTLTNKARSLVYGVESRRRGYLLTGDPSFLEEMAALRVEVDALLGDSGVADLVRDHPDQHRRALALRDLLTGWEREGKAEVALRRSGNTQEALRHFGRGATRRQIMEIQQAFSDFIAVEEHLRRKRADTADLASRATLLIGGVVTLLIGLLLASITRRQMRGLSGQYEAALAQEQAQRERFATTLASIGDGVLVTDAAGRITQMNRVAEQLTAWSAEEARDRPHTEVFQIFHETTGEPVASPVEETLRTGTMVTLANHTELRRRDGGVIAIEDSAAPIRDEAGALSGAVLVFRDVTERRKAANELAASEQRFRVMADSMPQLVWVTNADGHPLYYNRRWYEYTGLTEEESLERGFTRTLHPDDVEPTQTRWRQARENEALFDIEYRFRCHDGAYRWFVGRAEPVRDPDGAITLWVGTCTDIESQKQAEEALRSSEARHRFLFDTSPIGLIYQRDDFTVVEANAAAVEVSGLTRAQMLGEAPPDPRWHIIREDGTPFAPEDFPIRVAVRTGETVRNVVMGFFHPDRNAYRWAQVTAQPQFRAGDTRPHLVYAMLEDITGQREAREALASFARQQARIAETLQRALLMEERGTFSYPGLEIAPKYEAAWDEARLGGDFFDVFTLPDGRVALVVGDVTGKGLKAAARTAEVKFALRAFLHDTPEPAEALTRLNLFLLSMQREEARAGSEIGLLSRLTEEEGKGPNLSGMRFVSLSIAVVDPQTGAMACSAAGAEPLLVVRDAGGDPEEFFAGGVVLGAEPDAVYDTARTTLAPGDLLAIVTDGITEARRGRREFFGLEGLVGSLGGAVRAEAPLAEISEAVLADARRFANGSLQDDACLLFARRTPIF